jgi:hypothetical protein
VSSDGNATEEQRDAANREIDSAESAPAEDGKSAEGQYGATAGQPSIDPVEGALAEALAKAAAAGEWAVVTSLSRELEARRSGRMGSNVIDLGAKRRERR